MIDIVGSLGKEVAAFYEAYYPVRTFHSGRPEFRVDPATLELQPGRRFLRKPEDIVGLVALRALVIEPEEFRPVYVFEKTGNFYGHPLKPPQIEHISEELDGRWRQLAELMIASTGTTGAADNPMQTL